MGTLRFLMSCSLDGYVVDASGSFDWSSPSEELHQFFNDQVRSLSTFVLGRRMWETLRVWDDWSPGQGQVVDEFAGLWQEREKIVCSDSLGSVDGVPRTTLEPRLTLDRLAQIVAAAEGDVEIAGPTTAAEAFRAGMVDEIGVVVLPHVAGGGIRALPDGMSAALELVEHRTLPGGAVFVNYVPVRG